MDSQLQQEKESFPLRETSSSDLDLNLLQVRGCSVSGSSLMDGTLPEGGSCYPIVHCIPRSSGDDESFWHCCISEGSEQSGKQGSAGFREGKGQAAP